jgi:Fic family protein
VTLSIENLVRSMKCYYSNLLEGHDTHPRDIDRALQRNFSSQPKKRALQLEAVAHIEVQKAIDEGTDNPSEPLTTGSKITVVTSGILPPPSGRHALG